MKLFLKHAIRVAAIFVFFQTQAQSYLQIGSGTQSSGYPVNSSWEYGWYSAIYPQSAIGSAKTITKIAFECINGPKTQPNQKIYLKHTTDAIFANANYEDPTNNGYTLVYDGTINYNGWTEIVLSTPFNYNGTDNLIVHYESRTGAYYYTSFNSTLSAVNNNKSNGGSISFPTGAGYLNPYPGSLPNIRLFYLSSGPSTPANPVPIENATKVDAETELSFDLDAATTHYDVYFGTDSNLVAAMNASMQIADSLIATGAGTYSVDPTAGGQLLLSKTHYYWKVVAKDDALVSAESPVWIFQTQKIIDIFPYSQDFENNDYDRVFVLGWGNERTDWTFNSPEWASTTQSPQNGDSCAYISPFSLDSAEVQALLSPRFNLPANQYISFWWLNGDSALKIVNEDSSFFQISQDGGSTWTTLAVLSPSTPQSAYQLETIDLSAYAGNNVRLQWVYKKLRNGFLGEKLFLDNINIQASQGMQITLSENSYTYPDIALNGHTKHDVIIYNQGITDLVISGTSYTGDYTCSYSGIIHSGEQDTASIVFTPSAVGLRMGSITFEIDTTFSGNNVVLLSGSGLALLEDVYEYFDATPVYQLPVNWNSISDPEDLYHFVRVEQGITGEYNTPPNVLRMYNNDDTISPLIAIMPGVTNFTDNVLKFYAVRGTFDSLSVIVGLMDDPYDASSFDSIQAVFPDLFTTQFTVNLPTGNTKPYIAFKHGNQSEVASIRIDDVEWFDPNDTTAPNAPLAVFPIDNSDSIDIMSDFVFQWSSGGGNPAAYEISLGTNPEANNILNNVDLGDTTKYAFENLDFNTTYYWRIVAYNNYGQSSMDTIWTFETMQDPTITSFPYTDGFETNITNHSNGGYVYEYPLGWSIENNNELFQSWDLLRNTPSNPSAAYSGNNCMHMGFGILQAIDDWLFSPPLQLNAGLAYNITFWYKATIYQGTSFEKMKLSWGTDNTSASMNLGNVFVNENINFDTYTQGTARLVPASDGNYFIGFHCYSDAMQFILHLDEITISEDALNNETDIITYELAGQSANSVINTTEHSITAYANVSDSSSVVAEFGLSLGANAQINGITQVSGTTPVDFSENGIVVYTVIAEDGTTQQDWTVTLINTIGIEEFSKTNYIIYPNPVKDFVTIESNSDVLQMEIFNQLGASIDIVYPHAESFSYNTMNLSNGVYYIKIVTKDWSKTEKIYVVE